MARYLGPRCRLSRREKTDLMLTSGITPLEKKCRFEKTPGDHWSKRARVTEYNTQLRMKQMIKRFYGLLEKQFRGYYKKADRRKGSTGDNLLELLELRLDNVVYRMGFGSTRAEARQLVSHKAVLVNGDSVNIPSFQLSVGDVISVREKSKKQVRIQAALEFSTQRETVSWLSVDQAALSGTLTQTPDVSELPQEFKINLVVELYSK